MVRYLALCVAFSLCSCATRPVTSGDSGTEKVREWFTVELGGVEQTLLARGDSAESPLILFLHGGPGVSELPTYGRNTDLERDFLVVQWDQRGAGKSFHRGIPPESMAVSQFTEDTLELTELLLERFGKEKLYLVGFSFGSILGLQAVTTSPDLYHGYVGISQFVTLPESEEILDREMRERARALGEERTLARLDEIGPPPHETRELESEVNKIHADLVSDQVRNPITPLEYISKCLFSQFYFGPDLVRIAMGHHFSNKTVGPELYEIDLRDDISSIEVPTLWISGVWDTILSQTLSKTYFDSITAEEGKEWVSFEQSAHAPHLENPARFREVLREFLVNKESRFAKE